METKKLPQKTYRQRKLDWMRKIKSNNPCFVCKQKFNPVCMDFHHLDRKTKNFIISGCQYAFQTIANEIKKCIVVCANCHRLIEKNLLKLNITDEYIKKWTDEINKLSENFHVDRTIEFNGKKLRLRDWAKELKINKETLYSRIFKGWSIEKILTTPKIVHTKQKISDDDIRNIRKEKNLSYRKIALKYNTNHSTVKNIIRGISYTDII